MEPVVIDAPFNCPPVCQHGRVGICDKCKVAELEQRLAQAEADKVALSEVLASHEKIQAPLVAKLESELVKEKATIAAMREALEKIPVHEIGHAKDCTGLKCTCWVGKRQVVLSTDAGKELLERLKLQGEALAQADRVHRAMEEILGQKCLPSQMPRFIGDKLFALKSVAKEVAEAHDIFPLTNENLDESITKLKGLIHE